MLSKSKDVVAILLTGGGARSAYQLGVLKYVFKDLKCLPQSPILLGTSAGAINTFYLAMNAHKGLDHAIDELTNFWQTLRVDDIYRTDPWHLVKGVGNFLFNFTLGRYMRQRHVESLLDTVPLYLMLRKRIQEDYFHLHHNIESGCVRALGLSAMQYGSGKTITFFQDWPGANLQEWKRDRREGIRTRIRLKHVLASAAIPLIFPSVKLENAYYGDGSVRMNAPLSAAIALGATKIFAVNLSRSSAIESKPISTYPSISQIWGMMYNTVFLDTLNFDLRILNRINELVETHPNNPEKLRTVKALVIKPTQDLGVLALPFKKQIPKTLSFLIQGLGPTDRSSADFLSYILFTGNYLRALIDQGYRDAKEKKEDILKFFTSIPLEK